MFRLISNLIGLAVFIFLLSFFADPVTIARDIGTMAGETASAFAHGFSNGPK